MLPQTSFDVRIVAVENIDDRGVPGIAAKDDKRRR
jgi:hypothetical protein